MKPVSIIGMGFSKKDLTLTHMNLIEKADILIGGRLHLSYFENIKKERKEIDKNLKDLVSYIKERTEENKSIVVLASGDPLFYGIGSYLVKKLGEKNTNLFPNVNSVSAVFSRIKEPWHDAHVISLHGRDMDHSLSEMLSGKEKIAVFTDPEKNPTWLAMRLIEKNITNYRMCVLEQIGSSAEKIVWYNLKEAAEKEFADPNMVILKKETLTSSKKLYPLYFGMNENIFAHKKGLITKPEVRVVSLSKLQLNEDSVMWDLGTGSGSVSVEASLFVKKGTIYAVEKNPEQIENIEKNIKRFKVKNIKIVRETLPGGLDNLPLPDRIFIGGGGRDLGNIITESIKYLKKDGIMVVNTVILKNLDVAIDTLKKYEFETEIVQMQVGRSHDMPWGEMLKSYNLIWIIKGIKKT